MMRNPNLLSVLPRPDKSKFPLAFFPVSCLLPEKNAILNKINLLPFGKRGVHQYFSQGIHLSAASFLT